LTGRRAGGLNGAMPVFPALPMPRRGRPLLTPFVLLLLALLGAARGLILRPFEEAQGVDVALIVLAGANVPAGRYAPLGRAIQKALAPDMRLWVGIPDEDMVRYVSIDGLGQALIGLIGRSIDQSID
jgi:hypothetical protein